MHSDRERDGKRMNNNEFAIFFVIKDKAERDGKPKDVRKSKWAHKKKSKQQHKMAKMKLMAVKIAIDIVSTSNKITK